MKKTPLERAADVLRRLSAKRRGMLRGDLHDLRRQYKAMARSDRHAARATKGTEMVRLIGTAQANEDAARDVGKLLALLDAITKDKKPATTGEEKRR